MLTSLELINFKSHHETRISGLGRIAAFVGPNGVGKTSILQAAQLVMDLGNGTNAAALCYPSKSDPLLCERVRMGQPGFRLNASGCESDQKWRVEVSFPKEQGQPWPRRILFSANDDEFEDIRFEEDAAVADNVLKSALSGASHLRLEASKLRRPSYPDVLPPTVWIDGTGLASAVAYLMGLAPSRYQRMIEQLRTVVPTVRGVRVNRVALSRQRTHTLTLDGQGRTFQVDDELMGDQLLFDTVDASGVPGHLHDDGTLAVLAILCSLSLPESPKTVLIDDIETGLHPRAQRSLMGLFRELIQEDSTLQILMTTHSRYIVDGCRPEEVWVGATTDQGPRVAQLDEHPKAFEALPMLTTGEFWGSEGEGWLQARS